MNATAVGLVEKGYTARRENRSEEARELFAEAAALAADAGDRSTEVDALRGLANSESDLGNCEEAARQYGKAIELLRQMDDPLRLAHAVRHLADVSRRQGRSTFAVGCYNEALTIYRGDESAKPLDLANAIRGFAILREELGDRWAAGLLWEEALKLYEAAEVEAGVIEAQARIAALATA